MTAASAAPQAQPAIMSQTARRSILVMLAGIVAYDAYSWYLAITTGAWQLYAVAGTVLALGLIDLLGLWLSRRGASRLGLWLTVAAFLITDVVIGALVRGLGLSLGLIAPILTAAMVTGALPRRQAITAIVAAAAAGLIIAASDTLGAALLSFRVDVPALQIFTPIIAALLAVIYGVYLGRVLADYSLRTRLIIGFLIVALIPLGILAAVNYRATQQALTDAANQALLGSAGQAAASIETFFFNERYTVLAESQLTTVGQYLAQPPAKRAGAPLEQNLTDIMQNWLLRDKRASAYLLLDDQGKVAISTAPEYAGQDLSLSSAFQQAMNTGDTRVSDIVFPAGSASGQFDVSVAVRDSSERFVGVLVARFGSRVLQDLVGQTNGLAGSRSYGVLFDENLQELADGTNAAALGQLAAPLSASQIAALQAQRRLPLTPPSGTFALNRPDLFAPLALTAAGSKSAAQFFTVQSAGASGGVDQAAVTRLNTKPWLLAFFEPRDVFLAPVQSETGTTLTLAALIAVVVTAGALMAAQLLADPLARLTSTAEKVATGDLSVRADVSSRDEIGALARAFNTMTGRVSEMVATLESRVAERTAQLQAASDISRATASVRNQDELLRLTLDLVRDRFGFYHASIFLIDEVNRTAVLRESTGPVGAQLKARGHKLAIGSQSLIGWVTANRKPRVALDVADDPFHFKNPLLPDTKSELAIPLITGDRLLGALDVQSTRANAFGPADVQVLQTLADQLSVAIENAELFQRMQASLAEVNRLYQSMTGATWRSLLHGEKREGVYDNGAPEQKSAEATLISSHPLELPLQVRDRAVGVIEIYGRPAASWTDEERAALGTVAAQVSAALETASLLEESQRRRAREQLINDITNQMRATMNPSTVVRSGIRELGRALGATEVVVRLSPDEPARGSGAAGAGRPEGQP